MGDLLERVERQDEREQQAAEAESSAGCSPSATTGSWPCSPSWRRRRRGEEGQDAPGPRSGVARRRGADVSPGWRSPPAPGRSSTTCAARGSPSCAGRPQACWSGGSDLVARACEVQRDDSITPEDEGIGVLLERIRAANERMGKLKEQAEPTGSRGGPSAGRSWRLGPRRSTRSASARRRTISPGTTAAACARIAGKTRVVMQEFLTRATAARSSGSPT